MQDQQIKECLPRVVPQGYLFIVFLGSWGVVVEVGKEEKKDLFTPTTQRYNDGGKHKLHSPTPTDKEKRKRDQQKGALGPIG
ncbi:hypothetical protein K457DRAFT_136106 [Linnemannia elongata AG-77]|uniref:Uncharacterized protein n=1 Tax=Linnemannia elongata AG-77 TaxID=1314771 RepID=A0A197K551_9FUNG|nr:hypothetical protein K457DRAFT_136106 [Linnemannia elongata AG-77]